MLPAFQGLGGLEARQTVESFSKGLDRHDARRPDAPPHPPHPPPAPPNRRQTVPAKHSLKG